MPNQSLQQMGEALLPNLSPNQTPNQTHLWPTQSQQEGQPILTKVKAATNLQPNQPT